MNDSPPINLQQARRATWQAILAQTDGGRIHRCRRWGPATVACTVTVHLGADRLTGPALITRSRGHLHVTGPWRLIDWSAR